MSHIKDLIGDIEIGEAVAPGRLVMSPLIARQPGHADYLTLDEALASGAAEVGEVSEQGQVPELLFRNRGAKPVLLLDGEELVGAKQNRILNLTILAPAGVETRIPVSCVEAGRWGYRSRRFGSSDRAHHARGRAAKLQQVSESMFSSGARRSDQRAVWDELANTSAEFGVHSDTAAMADIFEQRRTSIDGHVTRLKPLQGQVGAIFSVDGKIVGMDLFDNPATCAKLLPKLVRSYALGAISGTVNEDSDTSAPRDASTLLQALGLAEAKRFPAVGLGEDWRMQGEHIQAAALVYNGAAVHLCAFAV
jgi:ARG and Rhodanese-Phosphatase-superfamily-associated Protein domain